MRPTFVIFLLSATIAGCDPWMSSQPKYHEYAPAELFRNGRVLQEPVPGTIARGDLDRAKHSAEKPPLTADLLRRGQKLHDVFCAPCHDRVGTGNGMIVQRGMPRPPSYDDLPVRNADDRHMFDVISQGYGVMYAFADRIRPRDRWAIVAYLRTLQLSQHATLDDVPDAEREKLMAEPAQ
jgi:mono/diheme cytochrome c family protein